MHSTHTEIRLFGEHPTTLRQPPGPPGVMAGVTGLEPATSGVTGRRSNQLSYTPEAVAPRRRQILCRIRGVNAAMCGCRRCGTGSVVGVRQTARGEPLQV